MTLTRSCKSGHCIDDLKGEGPKDSPVWAALLFTGCGASQEQKVSNISCKGFNVSYPRPKARVLKAWSLDSGGGERRMGHQSTNVRGHSTDNCTLNRSRAWLEEVGL